MKITSFSFFILLLYTSLSFSQEYSSEFFSGTLYSNKTQQRLPGANIINLKSLKGVSSNDMGLFSIQAKPGDTILISFLGYQSLQIPVTEKNINRHQSIYLIENPLELDEVIVSSKQLTGILRRDVDIIPVQKPIDISMKIKAMFGDPSPNRLTRLNDALKTLLNPVDLIYNLFSTQGKDMRRLKKIQKEEKVRNMLAQRYDRELLSNLLNVNKKDVYLVLESCDYSERFLKNANDLQILEALLQCYNRYKMYMTDK
jgi:hypothetical protein